MGTGLFLIGAILIIVYVVIEISVMNTKPKTHMIVLAVSVPLVLITWENSNPFKWIAVFVISAYLFLAWLLGIHEHDETALDRGERMFEFWRKKE